MDGTKKVFKAGLRAEGVLEVLVSVWRL